MDYSANTSDPTNPLAAALAALGSGGMVPDSAGGFVPSSNSRYDPSTGAFLPSAPVRVLAPPPAPAALTPQARMQLAAALDPSAYPAPQSAPGLSPFPQAAPGVPPSAVSASPAGGGAATSEADDADDAAAASPTPAANSVAARTAQPAAVPAEDAYTTGLRQMHGEADATLRKMRARGDAAAASGNADIATLYYKQAQAAQDTANAINLKALDYLKPEDTSTTATKEYEYGLAHPGFKQASAPVPVTPEQRQYYNLPDTGAFTIKPGEAPTQIAGAGPQGEPLDQQSIDYLANRLAMGDNSALSGLGYSKVGAENRARVINRAASMGADPNALAAAQIGAQVGLGGRKQEARTVGALGGRINTFSEEAAQTGELALQASEAMPRGQWVPITAIEQMGQAAASNPALSRLQAANNEFATTYAKATNPSGIPTDEGRRAAFAILNVAKSPEAYEASVRQLQKGVRAIQSSVSTTRSNVSAPQPGLPPVGATTVINGITVKRIN